MKTNSAFMNINRYTHSNKCLSFEIKGNDGTNNNNNNDDDQFVSINYIIHSINLKFHFHFG